MNDRVAHPGRPRDPRLDDALLEAAREVFLERGYHGASYAEIARRAHVGTPAIYRRWPTKAAIAIDLVEKESQPEPIPDTGSIRRDLVDFVRYRAKQYATPLFHNLILPVVIEAATDRRLFEQIRERLVAYRAPGIAPRIRKAMASGELRRDTDPDRLVNMLMGTIAVPLLFAQPIPDDAEAATIVDQLLDGFAAKDGHIG